ncbi:MAG TPA: MFS transporter [Phycisphaerae bacterium]
MSTLQMLQAPHDAHSTDEHAVIKKVLRRLIPFLILCFLVNYIDRTNISIAQHSMENTLLGSDGKSIFVQGVFDFGLSIFFIPYCLLELPSILIQERVGNRRWIARIMISWGIVSTCFIFTQGPVSFYILRMLLGICEAGFFPGIILYLSFWVPKQYRARASAYFFLSTAFAQIIGNVLGGYILYFTGKYGLPGHPWQWLFVLEGIPSIITGIVVLFYLTEKPSDAHWLTPQERTRLSDIMAREKRQILERHSDSSGKPQLASHAGDHSATAFKHALTSPATWLLSLIYIAMNLGYTPVQFYTPKTLKNVLHNSGVIILQEDVTKAAAATATAVDHAASVALPVVTPDHLVNLYLGLLSAIPFGAAALAMLIIARHSDRRRNRLPHIMICSGLMSAGLILAALATQFGTGGAATVVTIAGFSVAAIGWFGAFATFWSLPAQLMTGTAIAAALAIINSLGNLMGNFVAPNIRKYLGDQGSLYFAAAGAAFGIVATLMLKYFDRHSTDAPPSPHPETTTSPLARTTSQT